jgi:dTDP-4-dehydrorhamnose reductase
VEKALVAGAAGMLGSEVAASLSREFDVIRADLPELDITDEEKTRAFVVDRSPRVVVNCAAWTDVDGAESNPEAAFAVNGSGAGNLAAAGEAVNALVVHMSTDYVFDGRLDRPYSEEDRPNPVGVYGSSKLEGERQVAARSTRWLIVRTAWLYGHNGRNFVETILGLAERGGPLRVVDDQIGSPTNARDLAGAIRELVLADARAVVNVTNTGSCTWFEFACEILDRAGRPDVEVVPVTTDAFQRPAPRPRYSVLSMERLSELLGTRPRAWQEALAEYIAER